MIKQVLLMLAVLITSVNSLAEAPSTPVKSVVLTTKNVITIKGPISGSTESSFATALFSTDYDDDEVVVFLDSPGGSIVAGNGIIASMKASGKKIICVAKFAASMAFVILQSCDKRYVLDSSIIMQHVASYGVNGQAPNNVSMVNFLEKMVETMDRKQAKRIGLEYDEFKARTRNDLWLYGVDAVSFGAADEVVNVTCTSRLVKKRTSITVSSLFGSREFTFSGCPLVGYPLPGVKKDAESIKAYNILNLAQ